LKKAKKNQGKASHQFAQLPLSHLAKKRQEQNRANVLQKHLKCTHIDFNRIPTQNTHVHIILKLQSPNYYYDSMNINVAMQTTISDNRNKIAMIFKQICDAVITSYPINIFSKGTLFTKVTKSLINITNFYATPYLSAKFFKN